MSGARPPLLAAVGVLPIIAYFGMASFPGKTSSAFRATVISMANLGIRASFCLLGPAWAKGSTAGDYRPSYWHPALRL